MKKALAILAILGSQPAWASSLLLNSASVEQLAALDGLDEARAASIVELREKRGSFSSVEELRVIHSLDETVLASLRKNTAIEVRVPVEAPTVTFTTPAEVLAQFANEPTIQSVQAWTNDYANTSPTQVRRWLAQSKSFAALPELRLEYRMVDDFDQGFYYYDENGSEVTTPDSELFPVINDADQHRTQYYTARVTWDLNELVMSSERIRVINEAQDIVKLRDKLLSEVTRLYFERRRVQVERILAPKGDMLARVKEELRLMELTANIDALTGGAFSGARTQ